MCALPREATRRTDVGHGPGLREGGVLSVDSAAKMKKFRSASWGRHNWHPPPPWLVDTVPSAGFPSAIVSGRDLQSAGCVDSTPRHFFSPSLIPLFHTPSPPPYTPPTPHSPRHPQPTTLRLLPPQATASAPVMCLLQQADYQECLHREKLKRRIASKALEVQHKLNPPAPGDGHH